MSKYFIIYELSNYNEIHGLIEDEQSYLKRPAGATVKGTGRMSPDGRAHLGRGGGSGKEAKRRLCLWCRYLLEVAVRGKAR